MTHTNDPIEEEPPLDPAAERLRLKMVRLLLGSLGIMALGLIAVFGAIVYKISDTSNGGSAISTVPQDLTPETGGRTIGEIEIPADGKIQSIDIDGSQIAMYVVMINGDRKLYILDWPQQKIVAEIDLIEPR